LEWRLLSFRKKDGKSKAHYVVNLKKVGKDKEMKSYLFLIAWADGAPSNGYDPTGIHSQNDLKPEFEKKNEAVFGVLVKAPNEEIAYAFGVKEAFDENYTGLDSTSICVEVPGGYLSKHFTEEEIENIPQVEVKLEI
jgi:hypothetical protein